MGQVSGLLNLFRQIGGSVGIALVGTLLTTHSYQNYLDLAGKVSLLDRNTQAAFYGSMNGMTMKMSEGLGMATGSDAAMKTLYYRLQSQVFMLSFNQLVWTIMIIFSLSFIPLFLIEMKVKPTGPIDAH
jgi:DHA2 family multidrug resistance protein